MGGWCDLITMIPSVLFRNTSERHGRFYPRQHPDPGCSAGIEHGLYLVLLFCLLIQMISVETADSWRSFVLDTRLGCLRCASVEIPRRQNHSLLHNSPPLTWFGSSSRSQVDAMVDLRGMVDDWDLDAFPWTIRYVLDSYRRSGI